MQKIIPVLAASFLLFAFTLLHEIIIVKGRVIDETGAPVPFASIRIKGEKTGVAADASGQFFIKVNSEKAVLIVAEVGYFTQEVVVGDKKELTIVLKKSKQELSEVVVTGAFGIRRNGNLKGTSNNYISSAPSAYNNGVITNTGFDREGYDHITENPFLRTKDNALSTFSIDVDAASYSNVRRFLNDNQLPPAGAVRIEEMVNYFKYNYPQPAGTDPFVVSTEISDCPWNKQNRLAVIGLQGKTMPVEDLPAANIVFLIDVSGSMYSAEKLPLVKQSLKLLVDQLREKDKVALCVYAGNAGLVLPSTNGTQKRKIKDAIDALEAGGSTAGGAGIQLAYKTAAENFIQGGNNRVILCTDGDFNVGTSSDDALETLIEQKRNSGVFLTVLGFGTGNYQDAKMQKLADKGNGNHAYIDQLSEARKVLVNEFGGTLFTIAKDVKLQVEFNPALVQGYRLIGYENRMLAKEDFNDDKKDAGELGSGHTVTAIYEIIPVGVKTDLLKKVDTLKYQPQEKFPASNFSNELMTIKLRYKKPDGNTSKLLEQPVKDAHIAIAATSENYRFAAAVAEFGMLLRKSGYKGTASYKNVLFLANSALQFDKDGYRKEFVKLAGKALSIDKGGNKTTGDEETEDAAFAQ